MIIYDRTMKVKVDVCETACLRRSCYWPRPDPGNFIQGIGYKTRPGKRSWLCGTREARGCPSPKPEPEPPRRGGFCGGAR